MSIPREMNIYIEESGTPFVGIDPQTRYYILTATHFSSNVDTAQALAQAKSSIGVLDVEELKPGRLRMERPEALEQLYELVFGGDWDDTTVSSVVLDKTQLHDNERYSNLLGLAVSLALRGLDVRREKEVDIIVNDMSFVRIGEVLRNHCPYLGDILYSPGTNPKIQIADLLTYAVYRRFANADGRLFESVQHLIKRQTPFVSFPDPRRTTPYVTILPKRSLAIGERVVNLRYDLNEASKLTGGKNLLKPSSKSEMFSALLASFKPLTDENSFRKFITGLHQYMYESSQRGMTLKPYISTESASFLHDLNRLRVYYSHDLEQDAESPSKLEAKYRNTGSIFQKYTGLTGVPSDRNAWESFRLKLLYATERMLQEALVSFKSPR
jgi:hypothetical protein